MSSSLPNSMDWILENVQNYTIAFKPEVRMHSMHRGYHWFVSDGREGSIWVPNSAIKQVYTKSDLEGESFVRGAHGKPMMWISGHDVYLSFQPHIAFAGYNQEYWIFRDKEQKKTIPIPDYALGFLFGEKHVVSKKRHVEKTVETLVLVNP